MPPSLPVRVGRYELLRSLGRGGMGEVFEAILTGPAGFHKRVAVKRVFGRDRDSASAIEQEARFGGLLGHPNVVTVWDLVPTSDGWLVAMELVDGPTVRQVREAGELPAASIVDVGIQVADGLAHIHELTVDGRLLGLVHRDVKPSNLLVDPAGVVKLTDLGIASLTGGAAAGLRAGTPGYAAPEQLVGRADPRSDLFSLGVVLAWLVSGRAPFGTGEHGLEAVRRPELALRAAGTLEQIERAVPGLGGVVARCLRADPELRWPSARALGDALRSLRAHAPGDPVRTVVQRWGRSAPRWEPPAPPRGPARPPLVGRTAELRTLVAQLSSPGVCGIRGPPGVGKSRLTEAAAALTPAAWVVPLDGVRSEDQLFERVARVFDTRLEPDPAQHLGVMLRVNRVSLLVLDPVDGVTDSIGAIAHQWAALVPELRIALVSRRRLAGVAREWVVPPMTPPDAVALFTERARAAVADADPAMLRAVVASLDGLPLAVEVAASRAEWVPLERIADGVRSGGGLHTVLSAAIADLDPVARAALSQLTVFAGGWTLEAAERVLELPDGRWALDVLGALLEHSLVSVDATGRFGMLEPVRAFAAAHLDDRVRFERRHGEAYARLWALVEPFRVADDPTEDRRLVEAEHDNLTAATERALARGDGDLAALCGATAASTRWGRALSEPLLLIRRALALPSRHTGMLEAMAGTLCENAGDHAAAAEHLERASARARAEGQVGLALWADLLATENARTWGRFAEAEARAAEVALRAERFGNDRLTARAAFELGAVHRNAGRRADAEVSIRRSIELYRRARSPRGEAAATNTLATLLATAGSPEAAHNVRLGAMKLAQDDGDTLLAAGLHLNLALDVLALGPPRRAIPPLRAAIAAYRRAGALSSLVLALGNLGHVLTEHGDLDGAHLVLEEACDLAERRPSPDRWVGNLAWGNRAQLDLLTGALDRARATIDAMLVAEAEAGDPQAVAYLRCLRASLPGDHGLDDLDAALAWATAHAHAQLQGEAHLARAELWLRRGANERAAEDAAHALLRLSATRRPLARVVSCLAALRRGDVSHASVQLQRAAADVAALELLPTARASRAVEAARNAFRPGSTD